MKTITPPDEEIYTPIDDAAAYAAEQGVLGAMLLNASVATDVTASITQEDFADTKHRHVWDAIVELRRRSDPVEPITVAKELADAGRLLAVGSATYLHTLMQACGNPLSGTHYAKIVKRASLRRDLTDLANGVAQRASEKDPLAVIADTQAKLTKLLTASATDSLVRFGTIADRACERIEQASASGPAGVGLPTGFSDLDLTFHGLQGGKFYLVAGLSGAGKSVLLGDFYRCWTRHKIPCCMVTPEMTHEEVWRRQASSACGINHHVIQTGELDDRDWSRLARWIGDTDDAPSWICDKSAMTLTELDALAVRGAEQHGWKGMVVDYAQKIRHRGVSREREVGMIADGLKEIAKKTGMAVVAGAQLNREATKRGDLPPKLSDLRESDVLAHEADGVILIHRPDYDDEESPRKGEADFVIAKNRGGVKPTITVAAQLHYQRFVDMAVLPGR